MPNWVKCRLRMENISQAPLFSEDKNKDCETCHGCD